MLLWDQPSNTNTEASLIEPEVFEEGFYLYNDGTAPWLSTPHWKEYRLKALALADTLESPIKTPEGD